MCQVSCAFRCGLTNSTSTSEGGSIKYAHFQVRKLESMGSIDSFVLKETKLRIGHSVAEMKKIASFLDFFYNDIEYSHNQKKKLINSLIKK